MDPFPPLNKIFSMIIQQERQNGHNIEDELKVLVNAAGSSNPKFHGKGRGQNTKVCSYCGKLGHTVDVCYRKHGFPPHFKFKNGGQANSVQLDEIEMKTDDSSITKGDSSHGPVAGFTQEQYDSLINLL